MDAWNTIEYTLAKIGMGTLAMTDSDIDFFPAFRSCSGTGGFGRLLMKWLADYDIKRQDNVIQSIRIKENTRRHTYPP